MNAVRSIYAPPNKSFDTDARLRASHALLFLSCWMPFARAGQFQRWAASFGAGMISSTMKKEHLNPSDLPDWSASFSQIVTVSARSTRTIYLSGQVSVDSENRVVGQGDLAKQAEFALGNLVRALASVGAEASDVVRLGVYIKNYRRDQSAVIAEALRRVFPKAKMPASTWLGVETLALDDLLIEIEATAVT
jgi:enamine deaminase RidA (YjgF/YER057c/UK114 family)